MKEIELTGPGFTAAQDRQLTNRQANTNSSVAVLTFALVAVGAIEALRKIGGPFGTTETLGALFAVMMVIILGSGQLVAPGLNWTEIKRSGRKVDYWLQNRFRKTRVEIQTEEDTADETESDQTTEEGENVKNNSQKGNPEETPR